MLRTTPSVARTTNGAATRACPTGTNHQAARQSTGATSNVISIPNPIVTADVPSGSIKPVSSQRPDRPSAAIATLARTPITTANTVAQAAVVAELPNASSGSIPRRRPGRISSSPSERQAASE